MSESVLSPLPQAHKRRIFFEIKGLSALIFAVFLSISLYTYDRWDRSFFVFSTQEVKNYGGIAGSYISDLLISIIGIPAYLTPVFLIVYGIRRLIGRERNWFYRAGMVLFVLSLCILSELLSRTTIMNISLSGGLIGHAITNLSIEFLSKTGSYVFAIGLMLISIFLLSPVSPVLFVRDIKGRDKRAPEAVLSGSEEIDLADRNKQLTPADEVVQDINAKDIPIIVQTKTLEDDNPLIKDNRGTERVLTLQENSEGRASKDDGAYRLPPIDFLNFAEDADAPSRFDIQSAVAGIEKKLSDFGVNGRIRQANPGPVVTMYEFEPAPGVKINRIVSLADDLALALKAQSVRVYPISGKAAIGIEVPNDHRATLSLRDVISSDSFQRSLSLLTLALGKDISGHPMVTDLSRMPHLLVAGTTGSGKSVFMNTMILSLLYKATPEQVKMLMIDPKLLELSVYADIPHLISPVITNPKDASEALKSIVFEMERRYKVLSEKGARSIDTFNRVCEPTERLPYIVVFIDELADLMFTAPKDVEGSITRLAQKARASGIHLILATQRPSVDVITGLIKANFPARISFQVTTKIDSRTILDAQGAEQLLGKGDMLFMLPGIKIIRVHGAYVSEAEVSAVTDFIKAQARPDYSKFDEIALMASETSGEGEIVEGDEYYNKAKEFAESVGEVSISSIQRRLKIGYNKAASIMEMFERDGLVGPPKGAGKPREYIGYKNK